MPRRVKAGWTLAYLSYPCPVCDAAPGERCITSTGNLKTEPHADRNRNVDRCPRCGVVVAAEQPPGTYCNHCHEIREAEAERAQAWKRWHQR